MIKRLLEKKLLRCEKALREAEQACEARSNKYYDTDRQLNKQLETLTKNTQLLEEYKRAVDLSNIVSKADTSGLITYVNDQFCTISGYQREELIGKNHNIIRHPEVSKETFADLWHTIESGKTWKGIIKNRKKDGGYYHVDSTIVPILDGQGHIIEYIAIRKDVTDLIQQQDQIKRQTTDSLTGLPNREKLLEDVNEYPFSGMALVNIDAFQEINGFYGHKIADSVLVFLAERLKELLADINCMLYKLPADEYAILLFGDTDLETTIQKLHDRIDKTDADIEGYHVHIGITIGATRSLSRPLVSCHSALKNARLNNKDILIYSDTEEIYTLYKNNLEWIFKLKNGLNEKRIVSYYQPIYNNSTHKIDKYESLVRFRDSDNSIIPPMEFLPVAKKSKNYKEITKIMLDNALEQSLQYSCQISVNLSLEDIETQETVDYIKQSLQNYPSPQNIIFEITESGGIENFTSVSQFVHELRALGSKIAIDDFGTGYSNFEYLIKLRVDFLKIDGTLIKNIEKDRSKQIIVETIVSFTKKLGIQTIAEFVGSQPVQDTITKIGVNYSQGYLFGKPESTIHA